MDADKVELGDDNVLTVSGLNGVLAVSRNTDHRSLFQIMVFKESDDVTDEQLDSIYAVRQKGIFEGAVYTAEIRVDRRGVHTTGLFSNVSDLVQTELEGSDSAGIRLTNFSLEKSLEIDLQPGEHLVLVTRIDGGFDISSAIDMPDQSRRSSPAIVGGADQEPVVFPNPAVQGNFSVTAFAKEEGEMLTVDVTDLLGRKTTRLYEAPLQQGANTVSSVSVGNLPVGTYFCRVTIGGRVTIKQLAIH